jgi:hypothetical protein
MNAFVLIGSTNSKKISRKGKRNLKKTTNCLVLIATVAFLLLTHVNLFASPAVKKPVQKTVGEKVDAAGDSIDDASITAQVKMLLLSHRSTSALNTTVETKEGVVTLGGKARSAAEKDFATKLVSDVYGVKGIVNTMTLP